MEMRESLYFQNFPADGDYEVIVLYENGTKLDPPVNNVIFQL